MAKIQEGKLINHGNSRVFDIGNSLIEGNPTPEMLPGDVPLSNNVIRYPESPLDMDVGSCGKALEMPDVFDLLPEDYGAQETVGTSFHVDAVDTIIGLTDSSKELFTKPCYNTPVHVVKVKFQTSEPPKNVTSLRENLTLREKKTLPPRVEVATQACQKPIQTGQMPHPVVQQAVQMPHVANLQKECQNPQATIGQPQTFTQGIEQARQLLNKCGIDIRTGGESGDLGIVNIRSMSVDEEAEVAQIEKEQPKLPKDKFEANQIIYGTDEALSDLVKYRDVLPNGVHGVYTNKKFGFLEMSLRLPEEYCGIRYIHSLGQGAFGSVELWKYQGFEFVKKKIPGELWENEVLITSKLNHPNVLKTHGFIMNQGIPEIVMEHAGESLLSYSLRNELAKDERIIWEVAYYTLDGLQYLHENGIIHFDIKPENICIKEGPGGLDITIADFGSAKKIGDGTKPRSMTYEYMSPELCQQFLLESPYKKLLQENQTFQLSVDDVTKTIDGKTDVFSLGLVILFTYVKSHVMVPYITGGRNNYVGMDKTEELRIKLGITLQMATNPTLVQSLIPSCVGQNMRDLVLHLTLANPQNRLSASQALEWMKERSEKAEMVKEAELAKENLKFSTASGVNIKTELTRKVLHPRRPSSGQRSSADSKKKFESCQGVDLERVGQNPQAILQENDQLKNRIVKGWLKQSLQKRKNKDTTPVSGKQMKMETGIAEEEEDKGHCSVAVANPCNMPNFSILDI